MLFVSWLHWLLNYLITAIAIRVGQFVFPENHIGISLGVLH